MLFITIVTASMVKNTSSQSAASISYGTITTMTSTVRSGIVATESYFGIMDDAHRQNVVDKLTAVQDGDDNTYIYGTNNGRQRVSNNSNQYFRSKLTEVSVIGSDVFARFKVDSRLNSSGGRGLKEAQAFYRVDGVEPGLTASTFGGKDAFHSGADVRGDHGIITYGSVTFTRTYNSYFNDGGYVEVRPRKCEKIPVPADCAAKGWCLCADGGQLDNAFFSGNMLFKGNPVFHMDAYFDRGVKFQEFGGGTVFNKRVGVQWDIDVPQNTMDFGGNVYIGDGFRNMGDVNTNVDYYDRIGATIANGKLGDINGTLYHTDAFNVEDIRNGNKFAGENEPTMVGSLDGANIKSILGVGTREQRIEEERTLDIGNITRSGKKFLKLSDLREDYRFPNNENPNITPPGFNKSNITGNTLNTFINWARTDPQAKEYYKDYFYNDHFLITVDGNQGTGIGGGTFNDKVIFNVETPWSIDGNFYNSGNNASTLIYIGPDAASSDNRRPTITSMGMPDDGTFRGLIYVDPANGISNKVGNMTFTWGARNKIEGALIMKGQEMVNWGKRSGVGTNLADATVISRNSEVLSAFGCLRVGIDCSTGALQTKTDNNGNPVPISLKPLGYYFH
jgi:hypothetical protein